MDAATPSNKVLIIGAGVGGFCLAQLLRKYEVPFQIFERDTALNTRGEARAVALHESLKALIPMLPPELGEIACTSVNASTSVPDSFAILSNAGKVQHSLGGVPPGAPGYILRVTRGGIREYFSRDIPVTYSAHFSHYTESLTEGVTAYFHNRPPVTGSILVGFDGANSSIRSQLLPSHRSEVFTAPFLPIIGNCTLPREVFLPLHKKGSAALMGSTPDHKTRLLLSLLSVSPSGETADYYWALCLHSATPDTDAKALASSSRDSIWRLVEARLAALPSAMSNVVLDAGAESISLPLFTFREFTPPSPSRTKTASCSRRAEGERPDEGRGCWPSTTRVTLAGDAAHAMMPFGLAGANSAIQDACQLARILGEGGVDLAEAESVHDGLVRYVAEMAPRGAKAVVASRGGVEGLSKELLAEAQEMAKCQQGRDGCGRRLCAR